MKKFQIPSDQIRPIVTGKGSCIASDRITVDGQKIGFMYRENPDGIIDSGWRFFAGDESQSYTDNPKNFEIYDLNTIANYDSTIIELLDSPVISAFERNEASGELNPVDFPIPGLQ